MGPLARLCSAVALLAFVVVACAPEQPLGDPKLERGRAVYRALDCGGCHAANIIGRRLGPPLDHIGTLAAQREPGVSAVDYLRQSIVDPGAYLVPGYTDSMPRGLARDLPPEDLDALVAYLASLR